MCSSIPQSPRRKETARCAARGKTPGGPAPAESGSTASPPCAPPAPFRHLDSCCRQECISPTSILEKCVKRTRRNTKTVFRRVPARQKRNQPDNVLFRSAACRSPHRHVWAMALTIKLTGLHSSTQKTALPLPSQSFSGIHPPGRPEALHLAADRREINPSPPGVFKSTGKCALASPSSRNAALSGALQRPMPMRPPAFPANQN